MPRYEGYKRGRDAIAGQPHTAEVPKRTVGVGEMITIGDPGTHPRRKRHPGMGRSA